ncbi:Hypothetical predicted protein [Podarcis lilfordi]|uniref:Uncharacterized protein n=1 Tax=Podarcis lilfordi TaxID=74358 RepID=A0AA35KLH7_9SAUR|nr:Hypothetical predicted protein [Podarcis lilfordi]
MWSLAKQNQNKGHACFPSLVYIRCEPGHIQEMQFYMHICFSGSCWHLLVSRVRLGDEVTFMAVNQNKFSETSEFTQDCFGACEFTGGGGYLPSILKLHIFFSSVKNGNK